MSQAEARADQPEGDAEPDNQRVPWTVGDGVVAVLLLAVISVFLGVAMEAVRAAGLLSRIEAFRVLAPASVAAMFLLVWAFAVRKRGGSLADLGLKKSRWLGDFGLAVLGEVAVLLVVMGYATLLLYLAKTKLPQQPVVELFGRSGAGIALAVLYVAVLAPIGEELFFRGFIYGTMRQRWGVRWGMVASAGLFALFHVHPLLYVPMFSIGVALALLYQYRGTLVPAIMLHGLNNLLALVILFRG